MLLVVLGLVFMIGEGEFLSEQAKIMPAMTLLDDNENSVYSLRDCDFDY
jgi:hypothetical protein